MSQSVLQSIQSLVHALAIKSGDHGPIDDAEPLFSSGRLDSFSMMQLVLQLEEKFSIDFSTMDFDAELLDSIDAIAQLVSAHAATG
jgi:acyl carrier protein